MKKFGKLKVKKTVGTAKQQNSSIEIKNEDQDKKEHN
jgi:hypothetical protein